MYNRIRLVKGESYLSEREYKNFNQGDCIWGDGSNPEELKNWDINEEAEAQEELKKYKCEYRETNGNFDCIEYALEYYEADEDGEFLSGSDFDLVEEKRVVLKNSYDSEISFESLEDAKEYYIPGLKETLEEMEEDTEEFESYIEELENADSLEEFAEIWNSNTDTFENGSEMSVEII